jgi:aspartyl-tRNA(Asn)/glutamyl-tRNA(Gln) amidotransferase subunit C
MSLSAEQSRWVAHLARLDLSTAELDRLTTDLNAILDYFEQLNQVGTTSVEPLAHPLEIVNVFRDDELSPSLDVADALANAPQQQGDFFGVPPVFE